MKELLSIKILGYQFTIFYWRKSIRRKYLELLSKLNSATNDEKQSIEKQIKSLEGKWNL
jgi:hypothetical protein